MSHKRKAPDNSAPASKRRSHAITEPERSKKQYVYLAVGEEYGPYMKTIQHVFEIYATVEDANQTLIVWRDGPDPAHLEEWKTRYDKYGCFHSKAEDDEGEGWRFDVRPMEVKPRGSSKAVPEKKRSTNDASKVDNYGEPSSEERLCFDSE